MTFVLFAVGICRATGAPMTCFWSSDEKKKTVGIDGWRLDACSAIGERGDHGRIKPA